jgi:hypothetical protein
MGNRPLVKRGPKRIDELLTKLERLKPIQMLELKDEKERNRALKFAREHGYFFVTRTHKGIIKLWRLE